MAILFSHTFADAADTLLENATPETGTDWDRATSFNTTSIETNGAGAAVVVENGIKQWCYLANPGSASEDQTAIVRIKRESSGSALQEFGVVAKCSVDGQNHVRAQTNGGSSIKLIKRVGGTDTDITPVGEGSYIFSAGSEHDLELVITGGLIQVWTTRVDTGGTRTQRIGLTGGGVSDSDVQAMAAGRAGLWAKTTGGAFTAPGLFNWQQFSLDGTASGGGGTPLLLLLSTPMDYIRQQGAVDQSIEVFFRDSTTGLGKTGLVAADMDVKYFRTGAAAVSLTESDLAAIGSVHTDGGVIEIGGGFYRLDLPDAALALGKDRVQVFGTATGAVMEPVTVHLTEYDPVADGADITQLETDVAALDAKIDIVDTVVDSILADTNDLQTRVPAALVGGRMDASVGEMAANVLTASAVAADAVTEIQSGLATAASVATSDGKLDTILAATEVYKKNTAVTAFGFFMELTDGSPGTGLTVTVQVSKDGGAFATVAGAVTEISAGFYKVNFTATEMNADEILFKATATGAKQRNLKIRTQA